MSNKLERQKLTLPEGHNKLLLHSCCAPCSGEVMETLIESGIDFSIFFYNPNIHPVKEYEIRKEENIRFAEKHNIAFIDCDCDTDNWFACAKGMENEPYFIKWSVKLCPSGQRYKRHDMKCRLIFKNQYF